MWENIIAPLISQPVTWLCLPLALLAAFLMGFTRSAFGAGGFVVSPLMVLALGPKDGLAVVAPLMIFAGAVSCAQHREDIQRRTLTPLLVSAIIGTTLGAFALYALIKSGEEAVVDRRMELVVGALSLGYVILIIFRDKIKAKQAHDPSPFALFLAGGGVSLSQCLANSGTPILIVFFNYYGWTKERFVSSQSWFLEVQNIAKLVPFIALGILHVGNFGTSIMLLPLALFGNWIGKKAFKRFDEKTFFRFFIVLLVIGFIASVLLISGRTRLLSQF